MRLVSSASWATPSEVDAIEGDGLGAHIMAANMGAVLSAGQLAGASGQQVLRGLIFGYELTKRTHKVAAYVQRETGRAVGPAASLVDAGNTIGATAAAGIAPGIAPGPDGSGLMPGRQHGLRYYAFRQGIRTHA